MAERKKIMLFLSRQRAKISLIKLKGGEIKIFSTIYNHWTNMAQKTFQDIKLMQLLQNQTKMPVIRTEF